MWIYLFRSMNIFKVKQHAYDFLMKEFLAKYWWIFWHFFCLGMGKQCIGEYQTTFHYRMQEMITLKNS